jgi:hypothetical protein
VLKVVAWVGASVGGGIGWWIGARIGVMTAFFLMVVSWIGFFLVLKNPGRKFRELFQNSLKYFWKYAVVAFLTLAFVLVEGLAGWFAGSLALLSDAGHNLADAAALGFSWYALSIANKPSHQGMTFGYHRVSVFAALANALSLVVIASLIGW